MKAPPCGDARSGRPSPWGLALLAGCACAAAAAPLPKRGPPTALATIGDLRLTLRRLETERSTSIRLDEKGRPSGSARESLSVRLDLQLGSRFPAVLATVRRGPLTPGAGIHVTDNLGKSSTEASAEVMDAEEGPVLRIAAHGLSGRATSLRTVAGNLPVYPEAKLVRFHIPWSKDDVPLTIEASGAAATLRRFQLVEEDSTLWVSVRPPAGLRVAPFDLPGSIEARAVDPYGNLVNNGGITRIEQVRDGAEPEYRLSAPALRRTPHRLTLDALCVGGGAAGKPFEIRALSLGAAR